jgi:hypothetical protein
VNLFDTIDGALAGALMFFAVHAGTVPAKQPQVIAPAHHYVARVQKRPHLTVEAVPLTPVTSSPLAAPKIASLPQKVEAPRPPTRTSPMPKPVFQWKAYPFKWDASKTGALPPAWVQLWSAVG